MNFFIFCSTIFAVVLGAPMSHSYISTKYGGRIINGSPARIGQFPWQVTVKSTSTSSLSFCGGSIISAEWILTAAHCVRGYNSFLIGFGSVEVDNPADIRTSTISIVNPNYNSATKNNDLALIRVPAITFNANVQPILLPKQSQTSDLFVNLTTTVTGFGLTQDNIMSNHLKYASILTITNAKCTEVFGNRIVIITTICGVGYGDPIQSPCNGDSGSPLFFNEGGLYVQIGIAAFVASNNCTGGYPSGYIRTSPFLGWISSTTGIMIRQ